MTILVIALTLWAVVATFARCGGSHPSSRRTLVRSRGTHARRATRSSYMARPEVD